MKEQLIQLLSTYGYPVRLQGSLLPKEKYPDSFFTYWNTATEDSAFYDNNEHKYIWMFTIYFYSTSPELVNTILIQAKKLLKTSGWIVMGKGYDVPSDEKTHTGRGLDIIYIEEACDEDI